MPFTERSGLRIHYEVEGSGPPLVLQHGSAMSLEAWIQFGYVAGLKSQYRLVLIDGRGHGKSDKPHDVTAYALPLRVADITAVLDELGIRVAHYWGYSMGGWIGFGMAAYAPDRVRSLIIGGAHPYSDEAEAFRGINGTDSEAFITALEQFTGVRATPVIREQILKNDLRALSAALQRRDSLESFLPTITMPCFLYVGEDDPRLSKVQACAKRLANVTFASMPNLNHVQTFGRSDLVLPKVSQFLESIEDR